MSYVSREIHTRQCCCIACLNFDRCCHTGIPYFMTEIWMDPLRNSSLWLMRFFQKFSAWFDSIWALVVQQLVIVERVVSCRVVSTWWNMNKFQHGTTYLLAIEVDDDGMWALVTQVVPGWSRFAGRGTFPANCWPDSLPYSISRSSPASWTPNAQSITNYYLRNYS